MVSNYLAALGSTLRSRTEPPNPEIEEWLRWGETYVQRLCPIGSNSYGPPLAAATIDGLE